MRPTLVFRSTSAKIFPLFSRLLGGTKAVYAATKSTSTKPAAEAFICIIAQCLPRGIMHGIEEYLFGVPLFDR